MRCPRPRVLPLGLYADQPIPMRDHAPGTIGAAPDRIRRRAHDRLDVGECMRRYPILLALALSALSLVGCLASDTQYQRPRSTDTPSIYANSPTPTGRLKDN